MRSRRSFIGAAVGTAGLLAGCIGQLGSDGDSNDDEGSNGEDYFISLTRYRDSVEEGTWELAVSAELGIHDEIKIFHNGEYQLTLTESTDEPRIFATGVSGSGTTSARTPDGDVLEEYSYS